MLVIAHLARRHQRTEGATFGIVDVTEQLLGPAPAAYAVVHRCLPGVEAGGVGPGHADEFERFVAHGSKRRYLIRGPRTSCYRGNYSSQASGHCFTIGFAETI